MFREFVIGNRESSVFQETIQVLRTGPFIARPVERIKADEGSRQFDRVEGIVYAVIYPRSVDGRPIQPILDHHLRYLVRIHGRYHNGRTGSGLIGWSHKFPSGR